MQPVNRPMRDPPFDPLAGLFMAQDRRPAGLAPVDPAALSPLQRALLVIDGTVTRFLEAYALEPVSVVPVAQQAMVLATDHEWLAAPAGTPVLRRSVLLSGARTGRCFAFAESTICTDRLPANLLDGLLRGGLSIGQVLLQPGVESRREGLWYGRERLDALPPEVAAVAGPEFLTRSYRVSAASRPLMVITERFPWPADRPSVPAFR